MPKTRFPFATVLVNSLSDGGDLEIVRRHTSAVNAKRYAEGRNHESAAAGNGTEYGIIVRTLTKNGTFDTAVEYVPAIVGTEASTRTGGKKRFLVATVTMTKDGNVDSVEKLHTSPNNAIKFATGANAEAEGATEYAVLLRATRDGAFPVIKTAK